LYAFSVLVREDKKIRLSVLSGEVLPLKLPMNGYFSHTGVGKLNCFLLAALGHYSSSNSIFLLRRSGLGQ